MAKEIDIVELANMVKGRIIGNFKEIRIAGTCAIDKYVENKISFIGNKKYGEMLAALQNAIILIPKDLIDFPEKYPQNCYIIVEDVLNSLMDIQDFFYNDQFIIMEEGIAQTAKTDSSARIGKEVYLGENVYIGPGLEIIDQTLSNLVTLGDRVTISPRVTLVVSSSPNNSKLGEIYPRKIGEITIGGDAWIATGAIILPGITIGKMSVVGAGSVVTEGIPSYTVVGGVPAKVIKKMETKYEDSI